MHWLIAAIYSGRNPGEMRGLIPRDIRQAHWRQEYERLQREERTQASAPAAGPWWRPARLTILRSWLP